MQDFATYPIHVMIQALSMRYVCRARLFNLALLRTLEVGTLDKFRNIVVVIILLLAILTLFLLHALVGFGEAAQRGERVGPELVEDAGNELSQLFILAGTVNRKSVGWNSGMDCWKNSTLAVLLGSGVGRGDDHGSATKEDRRPRRDWVTYPLERRNE